MSNPQQSQPHSDGHHHNGSAVVPPAEPQKVDSAKGTNKGVQGMIGDLAAMAAGLATKAQELASIAKALVQTSSGRTQSEPPAEGGQKAKQGALSNDDKETHSEQKGAPNNR